MKGSTTFKKKQFHFCNKVRATLLELVNAETQNYLRNSKTLMNTEKVQEISKKYDEIGISLNEEVFCSGDYFDLGERSPEKISNQLEGPFLSPNAQIKVVRRVNKRKTVYSLKKIKKEKKINKSTTNLQDFSTFRTDFKNLNKNQIIKSYEYLKYLTNKLKSAYFIRRKEKYSCDTFKSSRKNSDFEFENLRNQIFRKTVSFNESNKKTTLAEKFEKPENQKAQKASKHPFKNQNSFRKSIVSKETDYTLGTELLNKIPENCDDKFESYSSCSDLIDYDLDLENDFDDNKTKNEKFYSSYLKKELNDDICQRISNIFFNSETDKQSDAIIENKFKKSRSLNHKERKISSESFSELSDVSDHSSTLSQFSC